MERLDFETLFRIVRKVKFIQKCACGAVTIRFDNDR